MQKTYRIQITDHKTGETTQIVRDVCATHPQWVHNQCGTANECELQECLDSLNVSMWYDKNGKHLGPDVCGIEMFEENPNRDWDLPGYRDAIKWGITE